MELTNVMNKKSSEIQDAYSRLEQVEGLKAECETRLEELSTECAKSDAKLNDCERKLAAALSAEESSNNKLKAKYEELENFREITKKSIEKMRIEARNSSVELSNCDQMRIKLQQRLHVAEDELARCKIKVDRQYLDANEMIKAIEKMDRDLQLASQQRDELKNRQEQVHAEFVSASKLRQDAQAQVSILEKEKAHLEEVQSMEGRRHIEEIQKVRDDFENRLNAIIEQHTDQLKNLRMEAEIQQQELERCQHERRVLMDEQKTTRENIKRKFDQMQTQMNEFILSRTQITEELNEQRHRFADLQKQHESHNISCNREKADLRQRLTRQTQIERSLRTELESTSSQFSDAEKRIANLTDAINSERQSAAVDRERRSRDQDSLQTQIQQIQNKLVDEKKKKTAVEEKTANLMFQIQQYQRKLYEQQQYIHSVQQSERVQADVGSFLQQQLLSGGFGESDASI
eukprot:TRINITY_DN1169_c0_g1_i1.p1 TRINITY_DN1169_c0_g1~~TRINITY_DN1169_c0_g1_i1.p1  ORF type:complete len:461 (+),score=162.52 TRINITY_DN1169_c0_g1_i1:148-1530(+)